MTTLLVGTAYGQVLGLPIDVSKVKQKITKYGILKKQRINSIVLQPLLSQQQPNDSFFYSSNKHIFEGLYENQEQTTIYTNYDNNAKIIGIQNFKKNSILAAYNNGSLIELKRQYGQQNNVTYNINEILPKKIQPQVNKSYNRIISDNEKSFCLIGKEVLPFLFDYGKNIVSWNGKNVPNDQLDLRVPVNDVDAVFFKNNSSIACAHASNKIRVYDVRSNKQKPSADYHLKLDKVYNKSYLTKITTNPSNQNIFYVANDLGAIYACDIRKSMLVVGKFKNINSTVTDIKTYDNKLYTTSLDCYVRSYDIQSYELLDKHYMNKQLYSLQILQNPLKNNLQQYNQQALSQPQQQQLHPPQPQSKKLKKMRKRNKVNLKYLKPVNWDQVPIKQQLLQDAKQQYEQINPKDADSYLDEEENEYKIKNQHQSDSDLD